MCTIPFVPWIANAAARFSDTRGAVSTQARQAGCSRQAIYDQARKVHSAVAAEYSSGAEQAGHKIWAHRVGVGAADAAVDSVDEEAADSGLSPANRHR